MAYEIGTASGYLDVTDKLRNFLCGYGTFSVPAFSGVGNGTIGHTTYELKDQRIGTHPESVTEVWTITCTDATIVGSEVWSVVGSISGAQASAVTGVPYTSVFIDFEIAAGLTDFTVTDNFTFTITEGQMSANGQKWEQIFADDWQTGIASNYILLKGKGDAGLDEIWVALRPYANEANDYFNLLIYVMTGYVPSPREFVSNKYRVVPMWNSDIPYWFQADARRFVVSTKINTVYTAGMAGLFLPYATPEQYPYPALVLANTATAAQLYSGSTHTYGGPFNPYKGAGAILTPYNVWLTAENWNTGSFNNTAGSQCILWPTCRGSFYEVNFRENLDGTRSIIPYIISINYNGVSTLGEIEGVGQVSGFGAINSEDIISIDGVDHVVFQNLSSNTWNNYWALRLD